jgi:hypothetical protein
MLAILAIQPSGPRATCGGHPKLHRRLRLGGSWLQDSLGKNVRETPSQWRKTGPGDAGSIK